MTADPDDTPPPRPAPPGRGARVCVPTLAFGHTFARATDGTRVWVCRGCGRRVPFHTDGAST